MRKSFYRLRGTLHAARIEAAREPPGGPSPENIVWIFCASRSGSTWLRSMMQELMDCEVWEEPKVGQLFGGFYDRALEGQLGSTSFVMGDPTRKAWLRALRNFVLETARAANPSITPRQYLVVKEPDGAIGAPILMEALPESRMVLLVRDPRDIAASALDAHGRGNWMHQARDDTRRRKETSAERPDAFVRKRANNYLRHMVNAKRAYDIHRGHKTLTRYEDLKSNTLETMRRLFSDLGIPVEEKRLVRAVERHSWERVPEDEKGAGKFYRKGTPGGWRDDLTPEQARIVEGITAPLIREFYPEDAAPRA